MGSTPIRGTMDPEFAKLPKKFREPIQMAALQVLLGARCILVYSGSNCTQAHFTKFMTPSLQTKEGKLLLRCIQQDVEMYPKIWHN